MGSSYGVVLFDKITGTSLDTGVIHVKITIATKLRSHRAVQRLGYRFRKQITAWVFDGRGGRELELVYLIKIRIHFAPSWSCAGLLVPGSRIRQAEGRQTLVALFAVCQ